MVLLELYYTFLKIGVFSFGGGYAMLPLMEQELIRNRYWLSMPQFVDIIAIAEATPGPVAINSATFVGLRMGGFFGAIAATLGVVTPSLVILMIALRFLSSLWNSPRVMSLFAGLRPAVLALIALAAILVAQASLTDIGGALIASVVFLLLVFTKIHPIVIIIACAGIGLVLF